MYLLQRSTYHPPLDPGAFPGGKAMLFDDTVHRVAAIRRDCTLVKRLYRPVWRGPEPGERHSIGPTKSRRTQPAHQNVLLLIEKVVSPPLPF
ncbi:MAG: hypothetical protein E6I91_07185 [Chloroflexi bacterium]|nr:MAG: hypothetical protein E6I91_07185 [Chloroflexota bacterium]